MASKLLSRRVGHISVILTFLEVEQFLVVYFKSCLLQTMLSRVRFRGSEYVVRVVQDGRTVGVIF